LIIRASLKIDRKKFGKTLVEAIYLGYLVMFILLAELACTLIPAIAVPVVLLGTFSAFWNCLGFR